MKKSQKWLIANKLSLNIAKSNFLVFTTRNSCHTNLELNILSQPLKKVESTKCVGAFIDQKSNWSMHIENVKLKLGRAIGMLAKLRHYLGTDSLRQQFFAFIQSHVNYCLLNCGFTNKTLLQDVKISIKMAVRVILFKDRRSPSLPLFNRLRLFNFESNLYFTVGKFFWTIYQIFVQFGMGHKMYPT